MKKMIIILCTIVTSQIYAGQAAQFAAKIVPRINPPRRSIRLQRAVHQSNKRFLKQILNLTKNAMYNTAIGFTSAIIVGGIIYGLDKSPVADDSQPLDMDNDITR